MTAATSAPAADARCAALSGPREAIAKHDGRWIELTDLQRAFVEGVYVLNPNTPAGLPFGDKAALAQVAGDNGGLIFFIDGDLACTPMPIPAQLVEMIVGIGRGDVTHEGQRN